MAEEGGVQAENLGWWVPVLVLGVPPLLLVLLAALGRLESWTLGPDERAAQVVRLLEQEDAPDEVEVAVSTMLAQVAAMPRQERRRVAAAAAALRARRRRRGEIRGSRATRTAHDRRELS